MTYHVDHEANQSLLSWEMDHRLSVFEAVDNELGMILAYLEDMLAGIALLVDLERCHDWCYRPRNSNYHEILGIDFSSHPTAIVCLAMIDKIRNAA